MDQARVIDIHGDYRTSGVDWPRAKKNLDAIIIRAAVGTTQDECLAEFMDDAEEHEIPVVVYQVPRYDQNVVTQVSALLNMPGVKGRVIAGDIETSCGGLISEPNARNYFDELAQRTGEQPWLYSNPYYIRKLGNPAWMKDIPLWLGNYIYKNWVLKQYYKYFEPFLDRFAGKIPTWAETLDLTKKLILWQFTKKGDARFYLANATTGHWKYKTGIKSADLNVSVIPKNAFIRLVTKHQPTPSPSLTMEDKVDILWNNHEEYWPDD